MNKGKLTLCALLAAGCSDEGGSDRGTGGIATAGPGADSGSTGSGSDDSADGASGGDDGGSGGDGGDGGDGGTGGLPKFDIPVPDAAGTEGEDDACSKVDFVFVVDNSGSMSDNQMNLVNNFPGFAQEIEDTLSNVDSFHVGVVTTDPYDGNEVGCQTMGSMITKTSGNNSSNAQCGPGASLTYAAGDRFMTEADDLPARFMCAGQPGTSGDSQEKHSEAMMAAVSPAMNLPGACNAEFLRPDALLVLVVISDEDDDSAGDPMTWFTTITDAKGGVEQNIVLLSIISTVGTPYPSTCVSEETGTDLIALTEMFTNGFVGDVCAPDYGVVFHDAIGVIDEACDNFQPPG